MQLPRKALRDGQLRHTSAGQAVEASGHKVSKAEFTDSDGAIITGFFKPVGPDYTELSAKYSTAVSIAMRFALGDKVAEDRLVFNKQGQIVGTFSIAVDDYKPLLSFKGKVPSDQQEKELVCPSVRTLLKHDVASLLVSSWRYKDDDRHPGNFSLKYAIDPDMSLYNRTSKIKGGRLVDVIRNKDIEEATALQFAHITNFPNVPGRTHWPTYKLPDNYNFLKQNASYYEFQQLATNPALETDEGSTSFQEQMFNAMLKELLAFEPDMWMLAFDDYFGDTPLDYLSLDPYKSEQLSKYQPLLYNTVTDRESFAKHALAVFQQEYDELCRTVVFYPGCEKNEYGVSVVSFNHFLRNKPSSLKKTLDWAESQNKLMATHWDRYQLYLINPEIKLYLRDRGRPEISFTKLSEANLFIANEGEAWTSYQLSLLNPKIKLYLLEMGRQDISFTSLSEANLFIANEGNAWTSYRLNLMNQDIRLYLRERGRSEISFTSLSSANLFIVEEGETWTGYQLSLLNSKIKLYLREMGRQDISFTSLLEANLFIANEGNAWTSYQWEVQKLGLLNEDIKQYLHEMEKPEISFTSLSEANLFIANEGNAWTNYQLKVKERKRQEANEKEVETFDNIIDSPPLNGYIVPENGRYQLDKMRQRYHKIWRDSQLGCLKTIIEQTKALEKRLVKELSLQTLDKLDTTTTSEPAVDMSNITEAHQLIKACSSFESAMQIDCDPQNSLGLGLKLLDAFRVELIEICDKYYELPHVELHYDNNEKFCDDLRKLVKDNETKICNALHPTPEEKLFSRIAESIEQYACSLYFQRHLRRADKPLGTEEQHNYPALLRREHTEKELITSCLKALFDWAAAIDREVLIFYIEDVIRHYQQSSWGKRGEEVSVYLKNSPEDGANLLARILSIGGCESNSLNTHLISKLIPLMLKDTIGQVEVNLLIVQQAFEQNEFKAIIYAKEAQQYATTDPRFEHVCASKSMQIFNDTLYNWVATQTPEKFHELVKSAVGKYNPYSLNFFSSKARAKPVLAYLEPHKSLSNQQILAMIFCEGEINSQSLNTLLFRDLIKAIKKDINMDIFKQTDPGYKLILQISTSNESEFLGSLAKYAKDKTFSLRGDNNKKTSGRLNNSLSFG